MELNKIRNEIIELMKLFIEKYENSLPFDKRLLIKLEDLEISTRAKNCFKENRIIYVGDLIQKPIKDLHKMKRFGDKCVYELKSVMNKIGFSLGMKDDFKEYNSFRESIKDNELYYFYETININKMRFYYE